MARSSSTFRPSGSTQLRMIHRLAWDAAAVRKRLFAWAKLKRGGFDHDRLARAFLAVDPTKKDKRAGYKLPFADVVRSGNRVELVAIDAGLKAANARLPSADVPRSVKRAGQRTLGAYDFERSMRNQKVRRVAARRVRKSLPTAGAPLSFGLF
ncbi:MAG: hypothetical protein O7B25_12910 [Gammaproteobacteria bacterium]|nr:hypothetical protein [Gammaproteobacteria bacterium]